MDKTVHIKTYGCQMNEYDSARMEDVLALLGYARAESAERADLVILNTCHIREKASEKVFSELGRLRCIKDARRREGRETLIVVAGCVAQAEGAELRRRAPFVDVVMGPQTYHRQPEFLDQAGQARAVLATDFPAEPKFDHLPESAPRPGPTAFLTIQEGCDKFCSFCVVPYTRGAEFSRPSAAILAEARRLVAQGAREITLLGQNVNAYHGEAADGTIWSLGRLVRALAEVDGLARIRFTTSHPRDMDSDLIEAHGDVPQLMPFLHLPLQSGSDRILAAMNRGHAAAEYRATVEKLRAVRSDLALSSDFIVGYPGETDAEFEATLGLVEEVGFAQSFSFKYSPRPGTPAASEDAQVPDAVKDERLACLQALLREQQVTFNRGKIGSVMPVLIEKPGRHPGQVVGRSPWLQPVHAAAPAEMLGRILELRVVGVVGNSLSGEPQRAEAAA